jgi:hypothetical protein
MTTNVETLGRIFFLFYKRKMAKMAKMSLKKALSMPVPNSMYVNMLAGILYVYVAYRYLDNLKNCSCAEGPYVAQVRNAELLLLIAMLINGLSVLWLSQNAKSLSNKGAENFVAFALIMSLLMIGIYVYFCVGVYHMQKSLQSSCTCAMKWQRWLVYVQYGYYLFILILLVLATVLSLLRMR